MTLCEELCWRPKLPDHLRARLRVSLAQSLASFYFYTVVVAFGYVWNVVRVATAGKLYGSKLVLPAVYGAHQQHRLEG